MSPALFQSPSNPLPMSLDTGFYSLQDDYHDTKIDGRELVREIHDMNCSESKEILTIAKSLEINHKRVLTRKERQTLRSTVLGRTLLARFALAEGRYRDASMIFGELIRETGKPSFTFEYYVVTLTKMYADRRDEGKNLKTLSRSIKQVRELEEDLMSESKYSDHLDAHFLHCMIDDAKNCTGQKKASFTHDRFVDALDACRFYNCEDLVESVRCFDLDNMKITVKRSLKDVLEPHPDLLSIPDKASVRSLVLDLLAKAFSGELELRADEVDRLIGVFGSLSDAPDITRDAIEKEIFMVGAPDLDRQRVLNMALKCLKN